MSNTTTCYGCGWHGTARIDQHQCSHVIEISKLNRLNTQLQSDLKASQSDCKRVEVALKKVSDYVLRVEGERDRLMELIYKFSALEALIPPTKGDEK